MKANYDKWGDWAKLLPSLPNPPKLKSGFGKKCDYLLKFIPAILGLFQWFGANTEEERVCSLQYLGYKILRALDMANELYASRGEVLRDEMCDAFFSFVNVIDDWAQSVERFIRAADGLLKRVFDEGAALSGMGTLVLLYGQQVEWLEGVNTDVQLRKFAVEKCEEWGMNYNLSVGDEVTGYFRRLVYALFDGVILLSLPSHAAVSSRKFGALYENTLRNFCESEKWLSDKDLLVEQIEEECRNNGLTTNKLRESLLKEKYNDLCGARNDFLKRFDIKPIGMTTDKCKEYLGKQLYLHLNAQTEEEGKLVKMTDADLDEFLNLEARRQYVYGEISKLQNKKSKPSGIFREGVDGEKMADCFHEVHQCFFGKNATLMLRGKYKDEVSLVAFLFIVVEKEKLCKSNFYENCKKPFFDFFTKEAMIEIAGTEKTFYNRLADNLKTFREHLLANKLTMVEARSDINYNFQAVQKVFHGTKKYGELRT